MKRVFAYEELSQVIVISGFASRSQNMRHVFFYLLQADEYHGPCTKCL